MRTFVLLKSIKRVISKRLYFMKYIGMFIVINLCIGLKVGCSSSTIEEGEESSVGTKINGVSFVASRNAVSAQNVTPVVNVNANYAAVMPFGFVSDLDDPTIHFNGEQWFGETSAGIRQYADELQKKEIKIMVKPQLWIRHGVFTGSMVMDNEEDWLSLETSYSSFILEYAQVAQDINAELFCIGTELELFVKNRPEYWSVLIDEVKNIYKGKLTYAANWNEYEKTPFWDQMDYIGIDAYFPLSTSKTPTVAECRLGWTKHKSTIKLKSETYNKPVLFTEYGYRSVDFTGKEPWDSNRIENSVNLQAQTNATQSLFEEFWEEDWFAGGFVWKWFIDYENSGGADNNRFTPQNKPVEQLIKTQYGK